MTLAGNEPEFLHPARIRVNMFSEISMRLGKKWEKSFFRVISL